MPPKATQKKKKKVTKLSTSVRKLSEAEIKRFFEEIISFVDKQSSDALLQRIKKTYEGVDFDIHCPADLSEFYAGMTPLFLIFHAYVRAGFRVRLFDKNALELCRFISASRCNPNLPNAVFGPFRNWNLLAYLLTCYSYDDIMIFEKEFFVTFDFTQELKNIGFEGLWSSRFTGVPSIEFVSAGILYIFFSRYRAFGDDFNVALFNIFQRTGSGAFKIPALLMAEKGKQFLCNLLMMAIQTGRFSSIPVLMDQCRVDPNEHFDNGEFAHSAIIMAIAMYDQKLPGYDFKRFNPDLIEAIQRLLPHSTYDVVYNNSLLFEAIKDPNPEIYELVLSDPRADVHLEDVIQGKVYGIGAGRNAELMPLMVALLEETQEKPRDDCVRRLLEMGANPLGCKTPNIANALAAAIVHKSILGDEVHAQSNVPYEYKCYEGGKFGRDGKMVYLLFEAVLKSSKVTAEVRLSCFQVAAATAIALDDVESLTLLIEHGGIDVNMVLSSIFAESLFSKLNLITIATMFNARRVIGYLLNLNVKVRSDDNGELYRYIIRYKITELVEAYIQQGGDPFLPLLESEFYSSMLFAALFYENVDMIEMMFRSSYGNQHRDLIYQVLFFLPLCIRSMAVDDISRLLGLFQNFFDLNEKKVEVIENEQIELSLLGAAIFNGKPTFVQALLEKGVDYRAQQIKVTGVDKKLTPLSYAAYEGKRSIVELLLQYLNPKDDIEHDWMWSFLLRSNVCLANVIVALLYKEFPDSQNLKKLNTLIMQNQISPVMAAVICDDVEILRHFILYGACVTDSLYCLGEVVTPRDLATSVPVRTLLEESMQMSQDDQEFDVVRQRVVVRSVKSEEFELLNRLDLAKRYVDEANRIFQDESLQSMSEIDKKDLGIFFLKRVFSILIVLSKSLDIGSDETQIKYIKNRLEHYQEIFTYQNIKFLSLLLGKYIEAVRRSFYTKELHVAQMISIKQRAPYSSEQGRYMESLRQFLDKYKAISGQFSIQDGKQLLKSILMNLAHNVDILQTFNGIHYNPTFYLLAKARMSMLGELHQKFCDVEEWRTLLLKTPGLKEFLEYCHIGLRNFVSHEVVSLDEDIAISFLRDDNTNPAIVWSYMQKVPELLSSLSQSKILVISDPTSWR